VFEFEHFQKEAGLHTFTPSISKWIKKTNAIGLYVKKGHYGTGGKGEGKNKNIIREYFIIKCYSMHYSILKR